MNVTLQPNPDDLSENQALHMAKLAEAAERYEEMTQYMNRSVKDTKGDDLTVEQRNLISVGYKNLMSARRTAWRVTQQQVDADEENKEQGEAYKEKIADELGGPHQRRAHQGGGEVRQGPARGHRRHKNCNSFARHATSKGLRTQAFTLRKGPATGRLLHAPAADASWK